jgi:surfeit locus 1 family protein
VTASARAGRVAVAHRVVDNDENLSAMARRVVAEPAQQYRQSGSDRPRAPRSVLSLSLFAFFVAFGVAALAALGVWQLERRVQKLDLIERVAQRSSAPSIKAPGPAAWSDLTEVGDAYRRVRATGRFLGGHEVLVKAVTALGGGFWVVTPLNTDDGFTVLVNRGFVPPEWRDGVAAKPPVAGEVVVTGLLRMTEPKGAFLHANDAASDRWYSRDVAAMAAARGLGDVAPYFIDADASADSSELPRGGLTVMAFPNNHLLYALTWFALALMLLAGGVLLARDEWRIRKSSLF